MTPKQVWAEAKQRHKTNPSKCFQRYIREVYAEIDPRESIVSLKRAGARVEKISRAEAEYLILRYEWLSEGKADNACGRGASAFYGLKIGDEIIGADVFGVGTSHEALNICGEKYIPQTVSLMRGCCVYFAPKNAPSFLTREAMRQASAAHGWNIFVAYADEDAGELGQIYHAVGWKYIGQGSGRPKGNVHLNWRKPDGTEVSSQTVHKKNLTKREMFARGWEVIPVRPKKRFVWFEGTPAQRLELESKCRYPFLDYPTRDGSERGKCPICGAVFPSNRQRRKHCLQVHSTQEVRYRRVNSAAC
jgi:uncharacterized C2H2 Zn-finger protein